MKFTPSIAYGCVHLLDVLSRNSDIDISSVRSIQLTSVYSGDIVKYLIRIKWVKVASSKKLVLTDRGIFVTKQKLRFYKVQLLILDFIKETQPHWVHILRGEKIFALQYIPEGVRQVIQECGLADDANESTTAFWNEVKNYVSNDDASRTGEIGHKGERLTIRYEKDRTGVDPLWTAMEDSKAGYDVGSVVSSSDLSLLRIEAKATIVQMSDAIFYISENEWKVATQDGAHRFYLWLIRKSETMLARLDVGDIRSSIPENRGFGAWKKVGIPYKQFESKFSVTNYLPD